MKVNYLKENTKSPEDKKRRRKIRSMFASAVFFILLVTYLLIMAAIYILIELGIIHIEQMNIPTWLFILIFFVSSIVLGFVLTMLVGRILLKTVNTVAEGMSALARGNFDVRITLGDSQESKQLADGFNNLAKELKNTELLRSNFVNEYAHEFKTPIASIKGFAELLRQKDLSEEEREEYLSVIIEESNRLTALSSNSLNLSKIESQTILTDFSTYNLSEQIRNSILLFQTKWQAKNLNLEISLAEQNITANEELLKQVWINLIDNAIKFSLDGGTVTIDLTKQDDNLIFIIENDGKTIAKEDYEKVFEKFYRGENVVADGHGVGLAIVKKIVQLHGGKVSVISLDGTTQFTVSLPTGKKQK